MDRLGSIYLAEEQLKPAKYDNKEFFVLSKLEQPKDKNSLHFLDYCERQFFHKYEPVVLSKTESYIDYHRFLKDAPIEIASVTTQEEMKYYNENKHAIKKQKSRQFLKEQEQVCCSELDNMENLHNEPAPNPNHSHCGVCMISYIEYFEHIQSKEHIIKTKAQVGYQKMID